MFYGDGTTVGGKGIGSKVLDKVEETYMELHNKDFAYDKRYGTTNVILAWDNIIEYSFDSKISRDNDESYIVNQVKYVEITENVIATMAGDVKAVHEAWLHMQNYASKHKDASIKEIADSCENIHRDEQEMSMSSFVCGFDRNNKPLVYLVEDHIEAMKNGKLKRTFKSTLIASQIISGQRFCVCAIGTGGSFAMSHLVKKLKGLNNRKLTQDQAVKYMKEALFAASMKDKYTGGNLSVCCMKLNQPLIKISPATVVELYPKNFADFWCIDEEMLFIFYKPSEISSQLLQQYLGFVGGLVDIGHPLNRLKGGYYIQRVVFKTVKHVKDLCSYATPIDDFEWPMFISLRNSDNLKLWMIMGSDAIKRELYVARHSMSILKYLNVEEIMSIPSPRTSRKPWWRISLFSRDVNDCKSGAKAPATN